MCVSVFTLVKESFCVFPKQHQIWGLIHSHALCGRCHRLFICPFLVGHVGSFPFAAALDTAAKFLPVSLVSCAQDLEGNVRGSELLGHRVFQCSLLLNIAKLSSDVIIPVYTLMRWGRE